MKVEEGGSRDWQEKKKLNGRKRVKKQRRERRGEKRIYRVGKKESEGGATCERVGCG